MLTRLFGKSENIFAILATAVNVRFSVAYTVALEAEESREIFRETQKICIFLAPFIKVFGHISEKYPRNQRNINRIEYQLWNALQEKTDNDEKKANDNQKIVKCINAVAPLHKLPYPLAEWSFVFHYFLRGMRRGDDTKPSPKVKITS